MVVLIHLYRKQRQMASVYKPVTAGREEKHLVALVDHEGVV